jgi:galactonate dehydratase
MTTTDNCAKGLRDSSSDPIKNIETFYVRPRWVFVRVETEQGIVGWGEGTLEGVYSVFDPTSNESLLEYVWIGHSEAVEGSFADLKERFIGWDSSNIEDIYQSAYRHRFYRGGEVLMSALSGFVVLVTC